MPSNADQFENCQFGCGTWLVDNYINVDYLDYMFGQQLESNIAYHIPQVGANCYFLKHDAVQGIPFKDNQFKTIYHSHFLEHINNQQGLNFLKECFRVLHPGGTMRMLVPDLELWTNAYLKNDQAFLQQYKSMWLNDPVLYATKAQIFMGALHNHEHKMGYDFDTLNFLLEHIGFTNIVRTEYAQSNIPEIHNLEQENPRKYESVCLECIKP